MICFDLLDEHDDDILVLDFEVLKICLDELKHDEVELNLLDLNLI
jgi:hypothetical protein